MHCKQRWVNRESHSSDPRFVSDGLSTTCLLQNPTCTDASPFWIRLAGTGSHRGNSPAPRTIQKDERRPSGVDGICAGGRVRSTRYPDSGGCLERSGRRNAQSPRKRGGSSASLGLPSAGSWPKPANRKQPKVAESNVRSRNGSDEANRAQRIALAVLLCAFQKSTVFEKVTKRWETVAEGNVFASHADIPIACVAFGAHSAWAFQAFGV
jgi:hypothetical protein